VARRADFLNPVRKTLCRQGKEFGGRESISRRQGETLENGGVLPARASLTFLALPGAAAVRKVGARGADIIRRSRDLDARRAEQLVPNDLHVGDESRAVTEAPKAVEAQKMVAPNADHGGITTP